MTFDTDIEVHTLDKTYYTYTILEFQVSSNRDFWTGSTGYLHWESDSTYVSPMDQYPAFRELYMANFVGWFSRFDFNEIDGSDYPYDNMGQWQELPPQIEIWSDNLSNTEASYVSFTLHAPGQYSPIPEPSTLLLFSLGIVGLTGIRLRNERKISIGASQ